MYIRESTSRFLRRDRCRQPRFAKTRMLSLQSLAAREQGMDYIYKVQGILELEEHYVGRGIGIGTSGKAKH